jgi:hypothetical protein
MAKFSPEQQGGALNPLRTEWQAAADLALSLSDAMETGAIPMRDGVSALRMFAGFMLLTKELSK